MANINVLSDYEGRVRELEDEGLTRSDAQGVADAELLKAARVQPYALELFEALKVAVRKTGPLVAPLAVDKNGEHVDVWPQWVVEARALIERIEGA